MIIENLLCEICSSRPARLIVLRRRHGDVRRTFVCSECSNERSRLYTNSQLDLERVLIHLEKKPNVDNSVVLGCKNCGMTLADIIVDGKPGCCLCYARFSVEIGSAIEEAQGHSHHTGKAPEE